MDQLRIGVLGAAKIVKTALLEPCRRVPGVTVTCVAARDPDRAGAFAAEHEIPRVHDSYERLLADRTVDAVYLPLPAALHATWTIAAMDAGKHVLCEKPFTANAEQAEAVLARWKSSDRVVMEGYHSRYHPLYRRLGKLVTSGELGQIQDATATLCVPQAHGQNIRRDLSLGGGGLLDVGYYPVRLLRDLFGPAPRVAWARAEQQGGIDLSLEAGLQFEDVRATVVSSMGLERALASSLEIVGDAGRAVVTSPFHPQLFGQLRVDGRSGVREEDVDPRSTYDFQLEAFRQAIRTGELMPTDPAAAVGQLRTIDGIYEAAGMWPRPGGV